MSRKKLPLERATCRVHDWKMESHARMEIFVSVLPERPSHEVLAKHSIWKKVIFCFTKSLLTLYIYPHYPQIVECAFLERKPLENTLES